MINTLETVNSRIARVRLQPRPRIRSLGRLVTDLLTEPVLLRQAVRAEDWLLVESLGRRCIGIGYATLREYQGAEAASVSLRQRRRLIDSALTHLSSADENIVDFSISDGSPGSGFLMGEAIDLPIVCLSRGLMGGMFANFNTTFQKGNSQLAEFPDDVVDAFEVIVDEFESQLKMGQLRVYSMMTLREDVRRISSECMTFAGDIEQRLPGFSRSQAIVVKIMTKLREQGKGGVSEKIGRLAMRAGALTRETVASQAAYYQLAVKLLSENPDKEVARLYDSAAELAFHKEIPNGRNVQIPKLKEIVDGEFIEVEGFVTRVEASHSQSGLLSRIELKDESSNTTVEAAAVFMHLPHLGVTDGAFCRVNGVFRKNSKLLGNRAGIEVDKLSLSQLKKESWRIAFLQSADRWYQAWRNGINLYWSIGPHHNPNLGDSASQEGASELIYPHFLKN